MTTSSEKPVDLMIDLRERMIRIETLLEIKAGDDLAIATDLIALKLRTTALETEAAISATKVNTLKWVGGLAFAFLATFGSSLRHLFSMLG